MGRVKRSKSKKSIVRKKWRKSTDAAIADLMERSPAELVDYLRKKWPGKCPQTAVAVFSLLAEQVRHYEVAAVERENDEARGHFNLLRLIRNVLSERDHQFLKRQQTYHVAAAASLPYIYADAGQIRFVLTRLLDFTSQRNPVRGRIEIGVVEARLRNTSGVEISISYKDPELKGIDRSDFLRRMHTSGVDKGSSGILATCRQLVVAQKGHMWVDVVKNRVVEYRIFLPTSEPGKNQAAYQTYRYDISIRDFSRVRKSYGIKKSAALVGQVEHYVRALVRHPLDVVLSSPEEGIITTIYETHEGGGESVATRISQRLGSEAFRVGKKPVEMSFGYHLSVVPSASIDEPLT